MTVRPYAGYIVSLVLSVGMLALIFRELSLPLEHWDAPVPSETVSSSSPTESVVFHAPSRQEFAEILTRPPFAASRRPPPPPAAATTPAQTPPPPSNVILVGTLIGPQAALAMIKTPGAAATQRIRIGQIVGGWEVIRISKDGILLRAGSAEQEVKVLPPSQAGGGAGGGGAGNTPFRPGAALPH